MANHPVLIIGEWRMAQSRRAFSSENPALGEKLPGEYPISDWADCDAALAAATAAPPWFIAGVTATTGHPGFTAVGIPAALRRFAMLQCYDNVRPSRLVRDQPPNEKVFRLIDGEWRRGPVPGA